MPDKSNIFTIWIFTEKVSSLLLENQVVSDHLTEIKDLLYHRCVAVLEMSTYL